jgi:hypothetical protein
MKNIITAVVILSVLALLTIASAVILSYEKPTK